MTKDQVISPFSVASHAAFGGDIESDYMAGEDIEA
jgi:hypothetical protein